MSFDHGFAAKQENISICMALLLKDTVHLTMAFLISICLCVQILHAVAEIVQDDDGSFQNTF